MNTEDLRWLAARAATVEGHGTDRLAEVHERIRRARRRRAAGAGAAVAVVLAVSGPVIATQLWSADPDRPVPVGTPSPPGSTAPMCLPKGQVPTLPLTDPSRRDGARCRLVLAYYAHPMDYPGTIDAGLPAMAWLFSDGRFITAHDPGRRAGPRGFLEQRLTPWGVERVRTDFLAARGDPEELADLLFDLSLPAQAWQREQPEPYQPSWYLACYGGRWEPLDRSTVLGLLPAPARDVLRSQETKANTVEWEEPLGTTGTTTEYCTILPASDFQIVIDAIDPDGDGYDLGSIGGIEAKIEFGVILPNNESVLAEGAPPALRAVLPE